MRQDRLTLSLMSLALVCGIIGPARTEAPDTLSLDEAYQKALQNNEQIQASKYNLNQAREDVTKARSRLLPQIDLTANKTRQKELSQMIQGAPSPSTFQHEKNHRYQFQLTQTVYAGGKPQYGYEQRKKQANAQQSRHYRRVQTVLFDVARNYFQVLLAERNLEIAESTLQRAKNQLKLAEGRQNVGEANRTAVLRAEVNAGESREGVRRSQNELNVARQRLGLSLGDRDAPDQVGSVSFRSMPDSSVEELQERGLKNRRDLNQLRSMKQSAKKRLRWEQADFYPQINLVSEFSEQDEPAFSDETEDWRILLSGSYSLFSGWRETAEISQAKSALKESKSRLKRLRKEIQVEIRNVYLDLKTQKKVISTLREQVQSAEQNYEQVLAEFDEGISSSVDLTDAHTALQEVQNRLAQARFSFQLDLIRLKVVTGTFQNDLIQSWAS